GLLDAPLALVTLRGGAPDHRASPKAWVGFGAEDAARAAASFHAHAAGAAGSLVVPDARADGRFAASPAVAGAPGVRFYAGLPLVGRGEAVLGVLSVFDTAPRPEALGERQAADLRFLAGMAVQQLEFARLYAVAVASARIAASTPDAIICADSSGAITFWNRAAEAMFGYARDEAVGEPLDIIVPERLRAAHNGGFAWLMAAWRSKLAGTSVETPARQRSGREIQIELSLAVWEQSADLAVGAIIRDVTERKRAEAELRRTRAFADAVVEGMPAALFVKDAADLRYVRLNRGGEELWSVKQSDILGKTAPEIFGADVGGAFERNDREVLQSGKFHVYEGAVRRSGGGGGDRRLVRTTKVAIPGPHGGAAYLLGFVEDITERREAEARLAHMAGYDALTGLPNRTLFRERLEQAAAGTGPAGGGSAAVLCLDLDRFKEVNDTLGHPAGDALLRATAERLRGCVRDGDVVARLGGDEFAAVLPAPSGTPEGAAGFAGRVLQALAEPFCIEGHQLLVGTSIGIAVAPADGTNADTLLRRADMALYKAKAEGRSAWRFYEPALDAQLQRRRALEADLRRAVAEECFELHYQPLFRMPAGFVSGVEALLRWRRADGGLVPPADFIPAAEETGLIAPIGDWVLRTACAEVARWPSDTLGIAVNLSPAQFRRGDLVGSVRAALAASGLPPGRLELEITESVLLEDDQATLDTLRRLRALGVRIAMDDFGTGYSSLGYLQRFPFDKIKIDRSFVREMTRDANCMAIVRAVVSLGATLGATITAEGVETAEQLALLRGIGCEEAQGYLLGRPKTGAEVAAQHLPRGGAAAPELATALV
ncbi:MAG: EAL domain-containing protein, partial [Acetobacteraceae bacterium]|nr:EAL domain-containing protein [Acetobacteraceae bacterium]